MIWFAKRLFYTLGHYLGRYTRQFRGFSSNARLFLLSTIILGLSFSIHGLFFNLYIDSRGYSRTFLGELQSMPNLIALVGVMPAGALVDAIGRRRAILLAIAMETLGTLGIILAPGPALMRVSTATFGVAGALWMVSTAPFMMENSTEKERNALFSANHGLQILAGFIGTLVGGYLPTWFGGLMAVDVESPAAYAAALGVTVTLIALSLIPVLMVHEQPRTRTIRVPSMLPWRGLSNPPMILRLWVPNLVISTGAAILIPYMNLFFKESFAIPDKMLGLLFAVSSVVTGTATLASPMLANRWGRIRTVVLTQLISIPFLLAIGFVPVLWVAGAAFWMRAALMNMGTPLYTVFAMEQAREEERARVSGLLEMGWTIGWTVGPFLSGYLQAKPGFGFKPLFLITCLLYLTASVLARVFFQEMDDEQREVAERARWATAEGVNR